MCRYLDPLARLIDEDHLKRFEMFWEVAIDVSKLPDEYLLSPRYDERLKASHRLDHFQFALLSIGDQCSHDRVRENNRSGRKKNLSRLEFELGKDREDGVVQGQQWS